MEVRRITRNANRQTEHIATVTVRCPVCHKGRLLDAAGYSEPDALNLFCSGAAERADKPTLFMKCPKCGRKIGITFGKPRQTVH